MGLTTLANVYIIAMNSGTSFEELHDMASGHPDWIYALPTDKGTINQIGGLTRSTKILLGAKNEVLGRYKMGDWQLAEWVAIFQEDM